MMNETGRFTGRHVLAELRGIEPELLDDEPYLRHALHEALAGAGATVCDVVSKRFEPQGVTVLALLSESHASIHTYPEIGAVFLDIFTCGHRARPEGALELLIDALRATSVRAETVHRGLQADAFAEPVHEVCKEGQQV